jgi:DNA-binding beta-propeller fold protein YncE
MNMVSRHHGFAAVCAVLSIMAVAPVDATLVTVDTDTLALYNIDPQTAAATLVGNMEADILAGLAYDPVHDILYGTTTRTDKLYSIDYLTGTATVIGNLGASLMHGLAYDPSTETLFGTFGEEAGDGLYSIDVATGTATLIGRVGFFHPDHLNTVNGLAVDPVTHALYGVVSGPEEDWSALIEIDKETGKGTLIGEETPHFEGLAFDLRAKVLYGIDNWTGDLYTIDTGTGTASLIGNTGLGNPLGLEDVAVIPEPATVCLLGLGALLLLRTAKRQP